MSSEIPVGSPPVPPGRHAAPSGWYVDPVNPANERYWDGWQWSRTIRPIEKPVQSGGAQPGPGQPPPAAWSGTQQPPGQLPYGQHPYGQQPYGQQPYGQPGYRPVRPGPTTADGVPLSGWWWRALAISIDGLIVSVLSGLLLLPIYLRLVRALADYLGKAFAAAEAGRAAPPQPDVATLMSSSDQLVITLVGFAVQMVYIIGFLRWRSATPGKLIVGLRVVDVDRGRSAAKLTWSSVIARALVWVVPTLYPLLFLVRLVDIAMPLWNPKRQALHDVAAKTQVVKIR